MNSTPGATHRIPTGGTTSVSSLSRVAVAPFKTPSTRSTPPRATPPPSLFFFLSILLLTLPIQAQTRATLLEPVSVPIIQNGQPIGTGKARAGTIVQILDHSGDTVQISTPLGRTRTTASNLLPLDDDPTPSPPPSIPQPAESLTSTPPPNLPARSSIRIQEKLNKNNSTGRCRGTGESRIFTPTLVLGQDAENPDTSFRFFVVFKAWIKNPTYPATRPQSPIKTTASNPLGLEKLERRDGTIRTLASKQIDQSIAAGQPIEKTASFSWFNWTCSCCRLLNPPVKPQLIGWHAELVSGDKILLATQSSQDPRITKAVEDLKANPPPVKPTPAAKSLRQTRTTP